MEAIKGDFYEGILNWLEKTGADRKKERMAKWIAKQAVEPAIEHHPEKRQGTETMLHFSAKVAVAEFLREHLSSLAHAVRIGPDGDDDDVTNSRVFVEFPLVGKGAFIGPQSPSWPANWKQSGVPFVPTVGWSGSRADVAVVSQGGTCVLLAFEVEVTSPIEDKKLENLQAAGVIVFRLSLPAGKKNQQWQVPAAGLPYTSVDNYDEDTFKLLKPRIDRVQKLILPPLPPSDDEDEEILAASMAAVEIKKKEKKKKHDS